MKTVNFINPVPPKRQTEITRWFKGSVLLVTITLASIAYLQYHQCQRLESARAIHDKQTKHLARLEKLRAKTSKLEVQLQKLQEQLAMIDQLTHRPDNPLPYLTTLNNATGQHIHLTSFAYDNNTLTITGNAASAHEVTKFMKRLATSERFSGIRLVSLQPHSNKKRVSFSLRRR